MIADAPVEVVELGITVLVLAALDDLGVGLQAEPIGVAHAEVSGAVPGAPVSLAGTAVLAPKDGGSRLKFTATVEVNIPLVGGKLESFIGGKLAELVVAEQRFTTVWIVENI